MYPRCPVTKTRISLLPRFPGSLPLGPQFVEQPLFAQGIHTLPERAMPIGNELSIGSKLFHGLSLPTCRVTVDVFEYARLQDEKGTVDPTVSVSRLLTKTANVVAVERNITEASRRANGRHRRELAMGSMKR